MEIGIGLPNTLTIHGTTMADWARRAEERGFSCLSTIDRIVYPTFDSLTSLAVAAGATSRIGLFTDILLTPVYPPVWLAKATASLDAMSGGRLTLGLGVGGRPGRADGREGTAGLAGRRPRGRTAHRRARVLRARRRRRLPRVPAQVLRLPRRLGGHDRRVGGPHAGRREGDRGTVRRDRRHRT